MQKAQIAIFKADIYKAFDTVHWQFLLNSLRARNFPHNWILAVLNKVLKGQSRIILNSVAGKPVRLQRGVRQGDPLSPYLFNMAMDSLARWLQKLNDLNYLTPPFPQCKPCLLYADDTLLFLKPTRNQMIKVKLLFDIFGYISGLKVNLLKSELTGTCSNDAFMGSLAALIHCKHKAFPIKYLGLPLSDKSLTRADFLPLIDRVQASLTGWRASLLTIAGRFILTNSVLSALPQYYMSMFLLPKWVLKTIDRIRMKFLWHGHKGDFNQTRRLYMVNWSLTTRKREVGGLGIRDMHLTNSALLTKWMWQWINEHSSWWKEVTIMHNQHDKPWDDPQATSFWKNLKKMQPAFDASIRYHVGDGKRIDFWRDNWTGSPLYLLYPDLFQAAQRKRTSVSQACSNGLWSLQFSQLSHTAWLQKNQLLQTLQSFQISQTQDSVSWIRSTQNFSVQSIYHFLSSTPSPTSIVKNIWRIRAPQRVLIFAWLLLNNRLTTVDNLARRGWILPNMCCMCKAEEESVQHLFTRCTVAKQTRNYIATVFAHTSSISHRFITPESLQILTDPAESTNTKHWELTTCFVLWRERCRRVFADKDLPLLSLVREIKLEMKFWFQNTL